MSFDLSGDRHKKDFNREDRKEKLQRTRSNETNSVAVSHCPPTLRIRQRIPEFGNVISFEVGEWQLVALPPFLYLARDSFGLLLVQSGVAAQINGLRREGKAGAGRIDNVHDPQQDIFA